MQRSSVQDSMNEFARNLFISVKNKTANDENIFFAPASVYAVFSMLYPGAHGVTADELREVMCLPENTQKFGEMFCKLWTGIIKANNSSAECILSVANRLWAHGGTKIEDSYVKELRENHQSDAVNMDFLNNLESAVQQINKWVEEKRKQKIKNMLDPEKLSVDTKLLITNAMYFYGEWLIPFDVADTQNMSFHSPNGTVNVDMMYRKALFEYGEFEEYDCKVLTLSYRKCSLKFMIILPNKLDGIFTLEERLCSARSNGLELWKQEMLNFMEVNVFLPKFRICEKTNLVEPLKTLGLHRLFASADLSGISKTNDLLVSSISHAAYIDVNEKGTEVAATTSCDMVAASVSRHREFKVDHPALFMVVDQDTELILFLGRLCQPTC